MSHTEPIETPDEAQPQVVDVWSRRERPPRLSPEPLLRYVADLPCREAAAALGINPGTRVKWRAGDFEPGIHYAKADRIAIKNLRTHPSVVWGQEWWRL